MTNAEGASIIKPLGVYQPPSVASALLVGAVRAIGASWFPWHRASGS